MPLSSQAGRCLFDEVNGICRTAFGSHFGLTTSEKKYSIHMYTCFTCMHFTWIILDSDGDSRVQRQNLLFYENLISRSDLNCFISFHAEFCVMFAVYKECLPQFTWFSKSRYAKPFWILECASIVFEVHSHMFGGWHFQLLVMYAYRSMALHSCHLYVITQRKTQGMLNVRRCFDGKFYTIQDSPQRIPYENIIWIISSELVAAWGLNAVTQYQQRFEDKTACSWLFYQWLFYPIKESRFRDTWSLITIIQFDLKIRWPFLT